METDMELKDIITAIHQMSRADAQAVRDAAIQRHNYMSRVGFQVGDAVRFNAGERGMQTGRIIKINPKRMKVQCGPVTWTVTPNLLQPVS
jgi:transcription antitermination factor NusG